MVLTLLGKDMDNTLGSPVGQHIDVFGSRLADGITVPAKKQLPL